MSILSFFVPDILALVKQVYGHFGHSRDEIKLRVKSYKLVVDVCNNLLVFFSWDLYK
jgi:hypothetical protein